MNSEYKLIRCGLLFDGLKAEMQKQQEILIKANKILAVGPNLSCPDHTEIIDLSEATVTPGLIDAHVHLQHFDWRTRDQELFYRSPTEKAMAFLYNAQKALKRGFTTLRHLGSSAFDGYGALSAKRLINEGYFTGARIFAVPYYHAACGSHGDVSQIVSANPPLAEALVKMSPCIGAGVDFFRNSVREQIKYGADFIKVMATGGFSTPNDSPLDQQLSDDEMKAIIDTAHQLNQKVTAHVYAPALMQKLINLNIDCLEHGALMDQATASLLVERGVYLVPTFCPYDEVIRLDEAKLAQKSPEFKAKLMEYAEKLKVSREIIVNSDIKLGFGSDFVAVHNPYDGAYEYSSWLLSGINPFKALKAATKVNAEILGCSDIGVIKAGKLADLAAWKKDLLTDHQALLDCFFVMKDGVIYPTEKTE